MTPNQMLLASLQTNQLIRKSQEERSACMAQLVATGRGNSAEYQHAARQFREWDAVWRSNR